MLNNMMIIERWRFNEEHHWRGMCDLDFVIVREDDGNYKFLKCRAIIPKQESYTRDEMQQLLSGFERNYVNAKG
jgi:hypothetical protein